MAVDSIRDQYTKLCKCGRRIFRHHDKCVKCAFKKED